ETTQEALDRLRNAANQGPPWAYSIVLADLAGMRNTALALHRNLGRQNVYGDLRLVCLYGDDPVPDELQRSVTLLSRQAPDPDLRAALFESSEAPAAGESAPDAAPAAVAATPAATPSPAAPGAGPPRAPRRAGRRRPGGRAPGVGAGDPAAARPAQRAPAAGRRGPPGGRRDQGGAGAPRRRGPRLQLVR